MPLLRDHVGGDKQSEEQDQRSGDKQLRADASRAMVVDVGAGGTAHRAASLDHGTRALCADQVLAAHLVPLPVPVPRRTWSDLEP